MLSEIQQSMPIVGIAISNPGATGFPPRCASTAFSSHYHCDTVTVRQPTYKIILTRLTNHTVPDPVTIQVLQVLNITVTVPANNSHPDEQALTSTRGYPPTRFLNYYPYPTQNFLHPLCPNIEKNIVEMQHFCNDGYLYNP